MAEEMYLYPCLFFKIIIIIIIKKWWKTNEKGHLQWNKAHVNRANNDKVWVPNVGKLGPNQDSLSPLPRSPVSSGSKPSPLRAGTSSRKARPRVSPGMTESSALTWLQKGHWIQVYTGRAQTQSSWDVPSSHSTRAAARRGAARESPAAVPAAR